MIRRAALGFAGALILVVAPIAECRPAKASSAGSDAAEGLASGQRPPVFHVTDLEGRPQSLAQYGGKVVVLHFWATWCPYCRAEIPKLLRIHRELAARGVTILAVGVDENVGQLRQFVASSRLPYAVIADAEANFALAQDYEIVGIPATYVIGRDGRLAALLSGPSDLFTVVQRVAAVDAQI